MIFVGSYATLRLETNLKIPALLSCPPAVNGMWQKRARNRALPALG